MAIVPQVFFAPVTEDSTDLFAESLDRLTGLKEPSCPFDFQTFYMATDEEMEQLMQSLTDDQRQEVSRRIEEYEQCKKMEEAFYADEEHWREYEEEQNEAEEYCMKQEEELRQIYEEQYARDFVHLDRYRAHLNRYLHLQHLRGSSKQFLDAVTGMVDFFLLSKGVSCFADPELFYKTIARLHRVIQQTAEMIRKNEG